MDLEQRKRKDPRDWTVWSLRGPLGPFADVPGPEPWVVAGLELAVGQDGEAVARLTLWGGRLQQLIVPSLGVGFVQLVDGAPEERLGRLIHPGALVDDCQVPDNQERRLDVGRLNFLPETTQRPGSGAGPLVRTGGGVEKETDFIPLLYWQVPRRATRQNDIGDVTVDLESAYDRNPAVLDVKEDISVVRPDEAIALVFLEDLDGTGLEGGVNLQRHGDSCLRCGPKWFEPI